MVKLGDRKTSENVVDRRAAGAKGTKTRGRAGTYAALGFLAAFGGAVATVSINGVNWALDLVGLPRISLAPPLTESRGADLKEFASVILGDTERVWGAAFQEMGRTYRPATLVLYTDQGTSQCGAVTGALGPVYCIVEEAIYIDLEAFNEIAGEYGVEGDFPAVFVIAHEVAHHVQKLMGDVDRFYLSLDPPTSYPLNQAQVRFELQADCLAGVFTKRADDAFDLLESGDLDEGIQAALRQGDDTVQMKERGVISEASFTHGSGEQRARWFQEGFKTGEVASCDTWEMAYDDL